ncbi:MAG: GNAT family N-acetyltransferase [Candidatus Dormibacteria bacterium]
MLSGEHGDTVRWRRAFFAELDAVTLYGLLRLRSEVFVVEQACTYADLDGRDVEPGTEHLWAERGGAVIGYLRVLDEPAAEVDSGLGPRRIGRVAVAAPARGGGLAGELMRRALDRCPADVVLDAQSRLVPWYERLGFVPTGAEYVEDGIGHVPMRLNR